MEKVLLRQDGLFAQHRRLNEGLMAPQDSVAVHDHTDGSKGAHCVSVKRTADDS